MTTHFPQPISENIWDMKYRMKDPFSGEVFDHTVEHTWLRVAKALAAAEATPAEQELWTERFYAAMASFKFLPAGRIIAGAGTGRNVTLFNCYVMGTIPDSMNGIFESLKEAALTMQQGGGIGYDFSPLRPKGAPVKGVAADASGPLTFMDVWDAMCRTVMSAGSRRGAMMATMRCDHPDIIEFIEAKQDPKRLRMFNVSVLVTDAFMQAVDEDADWPLVHTVPPAVAHDGIGEPKALDELGDDGRGNKTRWVYRVVKARDLWDKIMRSTYAYAEPGVIFIDRINADNNLRYIERISATNPCGEQPLPPYGACLLGSINLAALVKNAYTDRAGIDREELQQLVAVAVRAMDNVNDVSLFPLPEQYDEAQAKRRIGLGITGLADALLMCGIRYGSPEAQRRAEEWAKLIDIAAYRASVELAAIKGPFPAFDADGYLAPGTHASRLPIELQNSIRTIGIRNSHLTSIAPTGTISLYAGNISSGVEPIFAPSYTRKVLQPDGTKVEQRVVDYAVKLWEEKTAELGYETEPLPPAYVDAQSLPPAEHVLMQAAVQKWVDTSISKTINCPEDISFEEFKDVYQLAYDTGCKGCTTYRPNDVTGSVLSVEPKKESAPAVAPEPAVHIESEPMERPLALDGATYKIKMGDAHAIYVTLTDIEEGGRRRPFEVFIATKNPAHMAWTTAMTRMISAIFRRPHDSSFVVEELKAVFDPAGGGWWNGRYWHSTVAAIGEVIELHMRKIGYIGGTQVIDLPEVAGAEEDKAAAKAFIAATCPKCFSTNTKHENGCLTCLDCGHSKCG